MEKHANSGAKPCKTLNKRKNVPPKKRQNTYKNNQNCVQKQKKKCAKACELMQTHVKKLAKHTKR